MLLVNAPSVISHVIMPVVSIATVAGMIAAGVVLAVTLPKLLQDDKVVLASSAIIVLNRFIPIGTVPFYADPSSASMNVIEDTVAVLKTILGNDFVNVQLVRFSSSPQVVTNVTDNNSTNRTTTPSTAKSTATTTLVNNYDDSITDATTILSIASTNRTAIIKSDMVFYFLRSNSHAISTTDIINALNKLQTPIALFTLNGTSDTRSSPFNKTLSKVEPPKVINADPKLLASQPSISPSLAQAITAAATAALNDANLGYLASPNTSYPMN